MDKTTLSFHLSILLIIAGCSGAPKPYVKKGCYALEGANPTQVQSFALAYDEHGKVDVKNTKTLEFCELPVSSVRNLRAMSIPGFVYVDAQGELPHVGIYDLRDCTPTWTSAGSKGTWVLDKLQVRIQSPEKGCGVRTYEFGNSCIPETSSVCTGEE